MRLGANATAGAAIMTAIGPGGDPLVAANYLSMSGSELLVTDQLSFGNGISLDAGAGRHVFVVQLDGDGIPVWGASWGSPASASAHNAVGNAAGQLALVGRCSSLDLGLGVLDCDAAGGSVAALLSP